MGTSSRTIVRLEAIKRVDEILAGMTCDGSFTGSVLIAQDENILLSKGYTTGSFSLKQRVLHSRRYYVENRASQRRTS